MTNKVRFLMALLALLLLAFPAMAQDEDAEATPEATEEMMSLDEMMSDEPLLGFWDACATPENLPETVQLGAIFGLSGPISVYGLPQQQSVELAVQEINASGYLGDTTLEVIFEDAQGARDQAINAMTKLVEEDEVVGVLGPTLSDQAKSADTVAQENGVPVMGVSNTAMGITEIGDFVFRNSLPESAVIPGTIAQATEFLGLEQVGVLYGDDDEFTLSGYDVFVDSLIENDVEILREETFTRGDADFSAQLTNLLADDPDALVVSALASEAIQIIIQARELGYDGTIIGGNGFNSPAVLNETGNDAEGLVVGAAWNAGAPEQTESSYEFIDMFEAAYGNTPDQFAAQAYTGAWLFATAIRCADSTDTAEIRDALAAIEDFESPLGLFSFEEREPRHEPVAQIVVDGQFAVLSTVDIEEIEGE
jgi:branched-chain amino acid transport system substrate-binding protein